MSALCSERLTQQTKRVRKIVPMLERPSQLPLAHYWVINMFNRFK